MASYQFFFILVVFLVAGVAAITLNQASNTPDATPSHVVVENLPEMPATPAVPDTVRL